MHERGRSAVHAGHGHGRGTPGASCLYLEDLHLCCIKQCFRSGASHLQSLHAMLTCPLWLLCMTIKWHPIVRAMLKEVHRITRKTRGTSCMQVAG